MAKRRRTRKRREASREPSLTWVFAGLLLAAFLGGGLRVLSGLPAMLIAGFLWPVGLLAAFIFGLYYFAHFVLPLEADRARNEGFHLLQAFVNGRLRPRGDLPPELPESFHHIGAGLMPSHLSMAITHSHEFTRATEPGFVRLRRGEQVLDVTDLRYQRTKQSVLAYTRDGIPLHVVVRVTCQVRQDDDERDGRIPYPVDRDAIFRLAYSESVDDAESLIPWHERICRQIAAELVAEISLHQLDTLYEEDGVSRINEIRQRLEDNFRRRFGQAFAYQRPDDCPIGMLQVSIGEISPPDDVNMQRIRDWQTAWECRIREEEAEGETTILRQTRSDHRFAQMEVTRSLLENLEEMRRASQSPRELTETVKLHVIETLEEVMKVDDGHNQLSDHMMTALSQTLAWLQVPEEAP